MKCSWWEFSTTWQRLMQGRSHTLRTICYSWTKHPASFCPESHVHHLFSLKLSKICYPAGLEAWCLTLCSQNCCHELSGLPPSFLLNLIVQKAVTAGSNVLPHQSVFFSLYSCVHSTARWNRAFLKKENSNHALYPICRFDTRIHSQ